MKEVKKILFPVDFSDVSPVIVPWALTMAKKFTSEIHLLFVARDLAYYSDVYVSYVSVENFEQQVVEASAITMEEFINKYFADYDNCKGKIAVGDPTEEILNYAENEGIDMIIIPTHGRKGIERIFFGSVARRVIKMSPVPVMSINPHRQSKESESCSL